MKNLLHYTRIYTPVPTVSEISTYSVSICYHRGLMNYYRKSRSIASSENTQILMIFTVLMPLWFQFAKNSTYRIVFTEIYFMLKKRR